jgi:hypothetical protein
VPFFLDTDGKSIEELTAFPISGDLSPPPDTLAPEQVATTTNQSRPFVGIGGKLRGWTTEPDTQLSELD